MKKILSVSIVALLAVTPMLASAEGANPTPATGESSPYLGVTVDSTQHIASTSFVQGAYNAAIGAVNAVSAAKQDNLSAGSGISLANNTVTVTGLTTGEIAAGTLVTQSEGISNTSSDTEIPTAAAVHSAIAAVASGATSALEGAAGNGLTWNSTTSKFDIANSGVDTAQIAASAVTEGKIADSNVTTNKIADSAVTEEKIADSAVTAAKLASGLVTAGVRDATTAASAADSAAYTAGQTIPSEKAVATAISSAVSTATSGMATQSGVVATIGASTATVTVPVYTTWNTTNSGSVTIEDVPITAASYTAGA